MVDFASRAENEAKSSNAEGFINVSYPFLRFAFRYYAEQEELMQLSSSTYREIMKFPWLVDNFHFDFEDKNGI